MNRFAFALVALVASLSGCQVTDLRGSATNCDVHGTVMKEDVVRTHTGNFDWSQEYGEARGTQFPNANEAIHGPHYPGGRARVMYCPECRRAKEEWLAAHQPG